MRVASPSPPVPSCPADTARQETVDPLPEARRFDPRDRHPAGRRRRHRARHRFRARLPGLAVLPRPAAPTARRSKGVDRMGAPHDRGADRLRDPRTRDPGGPRPSRSAVAAVALDRGRGAGRVPGVARAGDRSTREQRGVGHRPPDRRHAPRRAPRVRDRPCRLPGPPPQPREQPALHAPRRVHGRCDVRPAAVRVPGDRDRFGAGLPGLAADGRDAHPGSHRGHLGACPPPLGGRGRGRRGPGARRDRVANAAGPPHHRPPGGRGRGPVRGPGRGRRAAGPDRAVRLVADAPPGPRRGHLRLVRRARGHELLRGPDDAGRHRPGS